MKFMKSIMRSLLITLILPAGIADCSAGKEATEKSLALRYPHLSQYPAYQEFMSAPTPTLKNEAISMLHDEVLDAYDYMHIAKERDELLREFELFLTDNKEVIGSAIFNDYIVELQRIKKTEGRAKKRHEKRRQMPAVLEKAIEDGDAKTVFAHLNQNPLDIESVDEGGGNPLIEALQQKKWNVDMIKQLIKRTKNLGFRNDSMKTALHIAADSRDPRAAEIVKLLINKGAKLEVRDQGGRTPLAYAIMTSANLPVIETLLRHKAKFKSSFGKDQVSEVETMRFLTLPEKGTCATCDKKHENLSWQAQIVLLRLLVHYGFDVNASEEEGGEMTPLVQAIYNANEPVVKFLLDNKADMEKVSVGITPLDYAIMYRNTARKDENNPKRAQDILDIIKLLLQRGANKEVNLGAEGWTALMDGVSKGDFQVVKLLVEHGANTQIQAWGNTPLDLARQKHKEAGTKEKKEVYERIIEYLEKQSPEYKQKMQAHGEAMKAARGLEPHQEVAGILEEFIVEPKKPSKITLNALKKAIMGNYHSELDRILNEDISTLELQDEAQDTPFLLAIKYNNIDAVRTILTIVESLEIKEKHEWLNKILQHKNAQGFDAYQLAQELGHKEMIDLLAQYE